MSSTRTFEFKDDKSSKFWEITQNGNLVVVRYGKTGTQGQGNDKVFTEAAAASKHVDKLIKEKSGKGYVENCGHSPVGTETTVLTPEPSPRLDKPNAKKRPKSAADKSTIFNNPAHEPDATPESLLTLFGKDDTTNRLLAKHPRASAELLEKLSHSSDKPTRQGVAANPNTAPEIYVKLGQQFPKEFLANPALDLLLMVHPALLEEVPQALLARLLKQVDCPASLLTWAADHPQDKVQLAVAMNPKAPEKALEKLRLSQHQSVRESIQAPTVVDSTYCSEDPDKVFKQEVKDRLNSLAPSELHEAWSEGDIGLAQWVSLPLSFRLAKATNSDIVDPEVIVRILTDTKWTLEEVRQVLPNYEAWDEVAFDPKTPVSVVERLAKISEISVRRTIARKNSSPESVLEALAKDRDSDVRGAVGGNASTAPSVLELLAMDLDESIRREVARNKSTPVSVLEELGKDLADMVRYDVASNKSTPPSVLELLAKDSADSVRGSVAWNSSTPVSVLEVLAKDSVHSVRSSVAMNTSTPALLLKLLVQYTDSWARGAFATKLSTPILVLEVLAKDLDESIRRNVAGNKTTPASVLEVLVKDSADSVRGSVADNTSTPASMLEGLAKDSSDSVRRSVAGNASTPSPTLEVLAKDTDKWIRSVVAANTSTPRPVLEVLAKDSAEWVLKAIAANTSTPGFVLGVLANDKDSDVRAAVAQNHAAPPDGLAKLASDRVAEVAIGAISNPGTPLEALLPLVKNKSVGVRVRLAEQAHRCAYLCWALWRDTHRDVRQFLLRNQQLAPEFLDEMMMRVESEEDMAALLVHPQLTSEAVQMLTDRLLKMPATESPWYRDELAKADPKVVAAVQAESVLSYFGKDPNKAVLAKRALAPVMALCSGPFVEPGRIVRVAGSTDWLVRAAAARNTGTPPNLLKKLSGDTHPLVAALARNSIRQIENSSVGGPEVSGVAFDLSRVTQEILGSISKSGIKKHFNDLSKLFTDDVWCDQLTTGQISWMTAAAFKGQYKYLPFSDIPALYRSLKPEHVELMIETAVAYEKSLGTIDSLVRIWAAEDPVCPVQVLKELADDEDPGIVLTATRHPALPKEAKTSTFQRILKLRGKRLLGFLKNKEAPTELLEAKSTSNERVIRIAIAENHCAPVHVLEALAKDSDESVRSCVAGNSCTPPVVLDVLAKESDKWIRRAVAGNSSTPLAVLEVLAKDSDEWVRRSVAWNSSAPIAVFEVLVKDSDDSVRSSVAENHSTPLAVLEVLAKDSADSVRRSVAGNSSTPVSLLEVLAKDSDEWVRRSVAGNSSTPTSVLEVLATVLNIERRTVVAENKLTTASMLEVLAKDSDEIVRKAVAMSPSAPLCVLKTLSNDVSLEVRASLLRNAIFPSDLREQFLGWWLARLQKSIQRENDVRQGSAAVEPKHAVRPIDVLRAFDRLDWVSFRGENKALTKISRSKDWLMRLGVALHPSTTEGILKVLRQDSDSDVARAARMDRSLVSALKAQ